LATTPLKRKRENDLTATDVLAMAEEFLSPQGPTMIGPTPQRDGIVLGLFDFLPAATPSKSRTILGDVLPNMLRTPSKNNGKAESEASLESRARGEKTPLSTGKRFLLDRFVTPKKRKLDDQGMPTSALKGFSTPSFLRRDNVLEAVDEDEDHETTPRPAPWKRRGLGRSLSSMIQSMKKQEENQRQEEEDRLDEEAEIMREMEMEAEGLVVPPRKPRVVVSDILVEDSQHAEMPLGPDRGIESSESEDDASNLGRNGLPRKAYKKKGQKRTTRRVIMRPVFTKPKPDVIPQPPEPDSNTEQESAVAETQQCADLAASGDDFSEDDVSEYASDCSHTPRKRKTQIKKVAATATIEAKGEEKEGAVKKAARKVKATAHANYRRLKIKGKGGTGGGAGGKGRFGRRK
jgi:hypothetical protein